MIPGLAWRAWWATVHGVTSVGQALVAKELQQRYPYTLSPFFSHVIIYEFPNLPTVSILPFNESAVLITDSVDTVNTESRGSCYFSDT